jgi:periplasmic protein TonB
MYRSDLNPRDKGGAIAVTAVIHAVLLFVFLHLSGRSSAILDDRDLRIIDLIKIPIEQPPQPEPPRPAEQAPKPKEEEGGASRENIRSQATPVVAPRPPVQLPIPLPVTPSPTPDQGAAPTQGASTVPGPGTGAGGTGTGTGSGAGGTGTGGGGEGGIATRAQLMTPSLRNRDYPPELRRRLSEGAAPFVIFTVQPNGRVTNCRTYQTSGDPDVDEMTCRLVTARFVYRPARNRRGEPVASQMAYRQAN